MTVAWTALVFALFAAPLAGCAGTRSQRPYAEILQSWVGQDANELIRMWGAPARVVPMPNGNRLLVYREDDSYTTPPLSYLGVPSQTIPLSCQTEFEIDRAAVVIRSRHQGELCPR